MNPGCTFCKQVRYHEKCETNVYAVTFLGGPIGGETRAMQTLVPTYEVPVHYGPGAPSQVYGRETYRLEKRDRLRMTATYRWQNPVMDLKRKVERLEKYNGELETTVKTLARFAA